MRLPLLSSQSRMFHCKATILWGIPWYPMETPPVGHGCLEVVNVCMDQHSPVPFHLDDFTRYMERFAGVRSYIGAIAFLRFPQLLSILWNLFFDQSWEYVRITVRICENSCAPFWISTRSMFEASLCRWCSATATSSLRAEPCMAYQSCGQANGRNSSKTI